MFIESKGVGSRNNPRTNKMNLKEYSIMQLEAEMLTAEQEAERYADYLREDCYNGDARYEAEYEKYRDLQQKIEAELTRRYKKVRELVESDHFAYLDILHLRGQLDVAHDKRRELNRLDPRPESFHDDHVELECRITALWFLLTHAQLASVSVSPNTE